MQKLPLRERRYNALLAKIARLTRKRNEAIKTLVAAETALPRLERAARRMEFPTARAKQEDQSAPVTAPAAPVPVPVTAPGSAPDDLDVPEFLRRAGPIGGKTPAELAAIQAMEEDERAQQAAFEQRMTDAGFRKTGKRRRKAPPGSERAALLHTPPSARQSA